MTHSLLRRRMPNRLIAITFITGLLAACAAGPDVRAPRPTDDAMTTLPASPEGVSLALPQSEFRDTFNRAEEALTRFDWMTASTLLTELADVALSSDDHAYNLYLQARIAYLRGDRTQTLALLDAIPSATIAPAVRYRMNTFRHAVLSLAGEFTASARIALDMIAWLPAPEAAAWRRKAWRDLQRADDEALEAALREAQDPHWIGWLHLAEDVRTDIGELDGSLSLWQAQYPDHPANHPLPGGMGLTLNAATAPARVALLLPLSGPLAPAGKAVLAGYLAAYYAAETPLSNRSGLLVLDVENYASANDAYDAAAAAGAERVVGPLSKSAVAELALRPERPLPVLALNRIDNPPPATGSALVQFSLSPEDEAATLAEAAFGRGARSAVILSPDSAWGEKVQNALRQRWQALGGRVVSAASYRDQGVSQSVQDALGISASAARARRVRDMLATGVEFTARRRQDPDIIFLLSHNATSARSLKPLLSFHYAGDLDVYALSSIHSGSNDARNRDLSGINIVEMPWLLGALPDLRAALEENGGGSERYTRLHALGVDAYLVQANFARLASGADALFRGVSGLLTMDPALRIHRELSLATFDGGTVKPR